MQSVSSTIWTCVAESISYDDNHYTTGTSRINFFIVYYFQIWNKKDHNIITSELLAVIWVPCILRHPV